MTNLKDSNHSSGCDRENSIIPALEYKSETGDLRVFEYNEESSRDMYNYFANEANDDRKAYYNNVDLSEQERMQGQIYECHAKNAEQYLEPHYEESEVNPFAIDAKEYWDKARRCSDKEAGYRKQADYYMGLYEEAVRNAKKYDDE